MRPGIDFHHLGSTVSGLFRLLRQPVRGCEDTTRIRKARAELIKVFNRRPAEIWHLASPEAWNEAAADGHYRDSTRDQSLEEVGFIHCATPDQVTGVAHRFHADLSDELIALVIDLDALSPVADVRFEDSGKGELFPHIHGPLPTSTVVHAWPAEIRHGELYLRR